METSQAHVLSPEDTRREAREDRREARADKRADTVLAAVSGLAAAMTAMIELELAHKANSNILATYEGLVRLRKMQGTLTDADVISSVAAGAKDLKRASAAVEALNGNGAHT